MKRSIVIGAFESVLMAGAMFLTAPHAHAQAQDLVIGNFDTADDVLGWSRWWGSAAQDYEFDPGTDSSSNPNSGSLQGVIDFDVTAYGGDNQFALQGNFPDNAAVDGTQYKSLAFDLKWDTNSVQRPFGDFGSLEFGFRTTDYQQIWLTPTSPADSSADEQRLDACCCTDR